MIMSAAGGNYAAVSVGYRMSTEAKWPAQIYDCKAAIRWIRGHAKEYNLDADHIGVWGASAGGHLVTLLGTSGGVKELEGDIGEFKDLSTRVTCVVNYCGPQDFTMPLQFLNEKPVEHDPAVEGLFGGDIVTKRAEAVQASPVTYVTADDAPTLTAHGTKDLRVSFTHGERIDTALKKAGVESLFIPVTNGGHGFRSKELNKRIFQFLDVHLRGIKHEIASGPVADEPKK
jgi:acetyl esterase/lipase